MTYEAGTKKFEEKKVKIRLIADKIYRPYFQLKG
jgi:hypothetical protein